MPNHLLRFRPLAGLLLTLCLGSCTRLDPTPATAPAPATADAARTLALAATGFPETFETGTKTSYTSASVTLGSGSWTFNDALLGTSTSDVKTGSQSARLRNSGTIGMNFDLSGGAGAVTLDYATYGSDGSSTWELWASSNGGSSYTKVGSTITAGSGSLQTASFTVNLAGTVRLQVRKTDGSSNRLNLDNLTVQSYSGSGTGTGGGGSTGGGTSTGSKRFLFDGAHAETAGNADWVPDENSGSIASTPTPAQSGITSSTSETYWTGGLSAWAVALAKLGHTINALPAGSSLTYGTSSTLDLKNFDVLVIDEPNTKFTTTEKTAILQFVQNGGGLFMISDHTQSDRNNDGYDSPAIWNDLMNSNSVKTNPFGFSIDLTNISGTSTNVLGSASNPILHGSQGNVSSIQFSNGATITTNSTTASNLVWQSGASQGTTNGLCASSTFGTGRVFVIADSSPADDGTGSSGHTLYPGWTENSSHAPLHLNASLWLAKLQ